MPGANKATATAATAQHARNTGIERQWVTADRGKGNRLIVVPHAGYGENAFYDRASKSLQFYYFGSEQDTVFTCLSVDIVNHEFAHAVLDGIRPLYNESSNPQTGALQTNWQQRVVRFAPEFNDARARWAGLTREDVVRGIGQSLDGRVIGVFNQEDEALPIVLRVKRDEGPGGDLGALRGVQIRHENNAQLTLH